MFDTKLDKQNMLGSLELLDAQMKEVLEEGRELKLPTSYKKVKNVVLLGMGGSAIGMHLIKSVFADELKVPIEIISDYKLPAMVGKDTLAIASSYSGGTEETLQAVGEAKKRQAKIVVISAGGKLAEFAKKNKLPALIFTTKNNPCKQPRMGLGYSIVGLMCISAQLWSSGESHFGPTQIKKVIKAAEGFDKKFGVKADESFNPAIQLAKKLLNKSVWFVGSEHLVGNMHIAANQMNENGKRFAGYFVLPELNHHLLEGMVNPKSNKDNLFFVLFNSNLYYPRVQKRYNITKDVLAQNSITCEIYQCQAKDKLSQACEVLVFSAYLSYYCAILTGIDPSNIPFVDYFKKEMIK